MRTFSEIVDEVVSITQSPHRLSHIVMAANGIIKDLDSNHDSDWALREVSLNSASEDMTREGRVTIWKLPCDFRSIRAIKVDKCTFLQKRSPGLGQKTTPFYWYQSGENIIINGCYGCIDIAYYARTRSFLYYDPKLRLLRSFDQCDWQWRESAGVHNTNPATPPTPWEVYDGSTAAQKAAYTRHVNWIIADHPHPLMLGTLSSVWNSLGDARGTVKYQEYVAAKDVIQRSRDSHLAAQI